TGRGPGNIRAVALPLVRERLRSGRRHGECRRAADRRGLITGLLSDAGRAGKPHPINRTESANQIIEGTIGVHLQVHGAGEAGGERRDLISVGWVQLANPTAAQVGEEINPGVPRWKLAGRGIVEGAADDGTFRAVRVLVDGIPEVWVGRTASAFTIRPAVVRPADSVIDLLPRAIADVVDKQPAGARLDGECERIAQAIGPNLTARAGHVDKRIVRGNRAVGINAENFSEEIGERL